MTIKRRILVAAGLAAAVAAATGAGLTHGVLWGMSDQFDEGVYEVADSHKALPYSHGAYAAALKYVDDSGMVHYAGLKKDRGRLDEYVRVVAFLKPEVYRQWDEPTKIAFWTNAYNALTLKLIVDNYPIRSSLIRSLTYPSNSIRQISGAWDKVRFLVMGKKMTLNDIEHDVLRKKFHEPRIHAALVCAAMSCPPLRNEPFEGKKLDAQLADQSRKFLANPTKFKIDRGAGKVHLSSIFDWFGGDFTKKYLPKKGFGAHGDARRASLHFASRHVSKEDATYLRDGDYQVSFLHYDWTLNERKKPIRCKAAASSNPAAR